MTLPAHLLPPLPSEALASADHDRAWDIIAAHAEAKRIVYVGGTTYPSPTGRYGRARTMLGRWERAERWHREMAEAVEQIREERAEKERRARDAAAVARIHEERKRLAGEQGSRPAPDPYTRASAYLASMGTGAGGAWDAVLRTVRGFALGIDDGAALVLREYAPRYHRKLPAREVRDMARRAMRARVPWGWLLEKGRRTW